MAHKVESIAYSGQKPWHGIGSEVSSDLTPEQMLQAAGLNWRVDKVAQYFRAPDGSLKRTPGRYALIRDDGSYLSSVGSDYIPVQNADALAFFNQFVEAGAVSLETAGSLDHGRYVWGLARLKADFAIGKGSKADEVNSYVLLSSPHIAGRSFQVLTTPTRVVCWNTLTLALNDAGQTGFRLVHSNAFDGDQKEKAARTIGLATLQTNAFAETAKFLSVHKATVPQVDAFFCQLLKFDRSAEANKGKQPPRALAKFQTALTHSPGASLPSAEGTWWGALNAVTNVVDFDLGRSRDTALKSAWLGEKAELKRDALAMAVNFAKAA